MGSDSRSFSYATYVLFSLCILPIVATAFIGFSPYDDEGLFLYMNLVMQQGRLPYRDFLIEYGPLYLWLQQVWFTIVPVDHVASRSGVALLAFGAALLQLRLGSILRIPRTLAVVASLCWLIAASPYFSESFHPGWYICILLLFTAYVQLRKDLPFRTSALLEGLAIAGILAIKPHLGLAAALLCAAQRFSASSPRLAQGLALAYPLYLVVLLLPAIQNAFILNSVARILPLASQLVVGILPFLVLRMSAQEARRSDAGRWLMYFLLGLSAAAALYLFAAMRYSIPAMYEGLIRQPSRFYFSLYSGSIPLDSAEALVFLLLLFLLANAPLLPPKKRPLARTSALALLGILLAAATPAAAYAWTVLYTWYALERGPKRSAFFFLACSQALHWYPIPASQLHYASVLSWLLYFELLMLQVQSLEIGRQARLQTATLIGVLVLMPTLQALCQQYLRATPPPHGCGMLFPARYSLDPKFAEEYCALAKFLRARTAASEAILTIPGFYSLLLKIERASPAAIPAARWGYLPKRLLGEILASLDEVEYAVLHHGNRRIVQEQSNTAPEQFDTRVYDYVEEHFRRLPSEEWRGGAAEYLDVYRRRAAGADSE